LQVSEARASFKEVCPGVGGGAEPPCREFFGTLVAEWSVLVL